MSKEYNPHMVIVWTTAKEVAIKEFSYKEDAESKYNEIVQLNAEKVVLAKLVKSHGQG